MPVLRPNAGPSGAHYGIDAPEVVVRFGLLGIAGMAVGIGAWLAAGHALPVWARYFSPPCLSIGAAFLIQTGVMLWASKVGKLHLRDRVLDTIPWRGDERVLDVGCGHGLMLIGAAKRLRTGNAVGIDLWQKEDQAGNSREATWQNVLCENVADRVELLDGDARKLPFPDKSFDVVLSSWALHNIYDAAGREAAVREIIRVAKPGGRLALVDIRHGRDYERVLREAKLLDVKRSRPNFVFVIPTLTVTARKSP